MAPIKGVPSDAKLGVGEFQSKYFLNNPVYMDKDKVFYSILGNKSLLSQKLSTWNPWKLYSGFSELTSRVKAKGIEGNLVGEGLLQGGVVIVSPTHGIVFLHNEQTGSELPFGEIGEALAQLNATCADGATEGARAVEGAPTKKGEGEEDTV